MSRVYLACNNDFAQMDLCKAGRWFSCRVKNTDHCFPYTHFFEDAANTFYKMLVKWGFTCVSAESLNADYLTEAYMRFLRSRSNDDNISFDVYVD